MKKINKFLSVLVASLAIGFVATSFIACSNDDDDDDDVSTVAVYKDSEATDTDYETVTFYSDNTVKGHVYSESVEDGFSLIVNLDTFIGTYTGDPTSDGTVKITVSKMVDEDSIDEEQLMNKVLTAVQAGKTSLTVTNSDFPLVEVSDVSVSAVISGKTATIDFDGETDTYTRQ
mgnify:FL=1